LLTTQRLKYSKPQFFLFLYVGVDLGFSQKEGVPEQTTEEQI
jgi:hypothetical protein